LKVVFGARRTIVASLPQDCTSDRCILDSVIVKLGSASHYNVVAVVDRYGGCPSFGPSTLS
jgi:hypothetical protein